MNGLKLSEIMWITEEDGERLVRIKRRFRRWCGDPSWPPAPCCKTPRVVGPMFRLWPGEHLIILPGAPLCCACCGTVYRASGVAGGWYGVRTGKALRPSALAAFRRLLGWTRAAWWAA